MNQSTQKKQTSADAYHTRAKDIARLMDVLQMELDKHADAARADPRNWGRVGELAKVRSGLIDLVDFLSGMGRQSIEDFLADADA